MWDGSEKAWPNWSFVMKVFAGSHRSNFVGGHDDCRMQYGCYEQRVDDGREEGKECALYFVLITLCTGRALDRIANAPHGWSVEATRMLFQAYSPENNARFFCDDARSVGVSDVNSLETMEQKIKNSRDTRTLKFRNS